MDDSRPNSSAVYTWCNRSPKHLVIRVENRNAPGGLVDAEIRFSNTDGVNHFWKQLYPGGSRDYNYNPDWIRQY